MVFIKICDLYYLDSLIQCARKTGNKEIIITAELSGKEEADECDYVMR